MSSVQRLQAMCESKQQEWDAVHARLNSLRQAKTIETDPENRFKLDHRIKIIEQELKNVQQELDQIEQQLSQVGANEDRKQKTNSSKSQTPSTQSINQTHRNSETSSGQNLTTLGKSKPSNFRLVKVSLTVLGIVFSFVSFNIYQNYTENQAKGNFEPQVNSLATKGKTQQAVELIIKDGARFEKSSPGITNDLIIIPALQEARRQKCRTVQQIISANDPGIAGVGSKPLNSKGEARLPPEQRWEVWDRLRCGEIPGIYDW